MFDNPTYDIILVIVITWIVLSGVAIVWYFLNRSVVKHYDEQRAKLWADYDKEVAQLSEKLDLMLEEHQYRVEQNKLQLAKQLKEIL